MTSPDALKPAQVVAILLLTILVGVASLGIYRLLLHPLSRFPGPKAACISRSWQGKQMLSGHAEEAYAELHELYKTQALRIGPNELHISDPQAYKTIYGQASSFPKHDAFYDSFNTPHTLFAETAPDLHRERRKRLNPLFSRKGILDLQPVIEEKVTSMVAKIDRLRESGAIEVGNMFRCMTVDIISQLAFGSALGLIDEAPDTFHARFLSAFDIAGQAVFAMYFSPIQKLAAQIIPLSVVAKLDRSLGELLGLQNVAKSCYFQYKADASKNSSTSHTYPIMFDSLKGIADELQVSESMDILIAGSDTTAFTLATALDAILRDPKIHQSVVAAADAAIPDKTAIPPYTELEKNEVLFSTVKEAMRLAMPVPGTLPRIVPRRSHPFVVDGQIVPPGTVVGMSAHTMHTSTGLWGDDAKVFRPDRWLGESGKSLEAGFVTFSKGQRQCIGINFAHAEIIITLTYLFRNYEMKLLDPTQKLMRRDVFTQQILEPGVRVLFKKRE